MTSRQHRVLRLMCRRPKPTLAKAARELKVTPERIRQIYHKGLRHTLWKIKKLKVLGESAPEPMNKEYYCLGYEHIGITVVKPRNVDVAAYQLHDLLSRPFCKAMAARNL